MLIYIIYYYKLNFISLIKVKKIYNKILSIKLMRLDKYKCKLSIKCVDNLFLLSVSLDLI
jgi:hypothetical protein